MAKATAKVNIEDKPEGDLQRVRFMFLESPKGIMDFSFDGVPYSLRDGAVYDLPVHIIKHLNNLSIPDSHYEIDDATGQMVRMDDSIRYRCTCVPV